LSAASAAAAAAAVAAAAAAPAAAAAEACDQGLTLLHFSAQLSRFCHRNHPYTGHLIPL